MTFDRPLLLLAGIVLPVLWLLARKAARRRDVAVAGLLLWRRIGLTPEAPRHLARRADRLLALRLAAAGLATVALGGPHLAAAAPQGVLEVVVDDSPSMAAFAAEAEAALRAIGAAAGGARLAVARGHAPADLLAALDRAGDGAAVFITDHSDPDLPADGRLVLWLVGRPVDNAGLLGAVIVRHDAEVRYRAVVMNYGSIPAVRVLRRPGGEDLLTLAPGEVREFSGAAPGGVAALALEPGDGFAFDDRVVVRLVTDPAAGLRAEEDLDPHVALALRAGGLLTGDPRARMVTWRREPGAGAALVVAPPGDRRPVAGPLTGGGDLAGAAVPDPATPLGSTAVLPPGGTVLLADREGPVAVLRETPSGPRIEVGLDPGDPASAWALDLAFPVFFAEAARLVGARADRLVVEEGVLDPEESATAGESRPADPSRLRASRTAIPSGGNALAAVLLGAAAVLLALHAALEARARAA